MLTTQNQGGGSKKAGLVPETASSTSPSLQGKWIFKNVTFMMKDSSGQPKCMARPTGVRPMIISNVK